jgi:predicted transposase/invertase (TIGR01784 family)
LKRPLSTNTIPASLSHEEECTSSSKCRKRGNFNLEDPLDRWIKYLIDPEFIKLFTMDTQYNYPNLKKAVELLDESNYTEGQLLAYDRYLDSIRSWNSSMKLSYEEGVEEGIEKGVQKGIEKGMKNIESVLSDLKAGNPVEEVAAKYELDPAYVDMLYRQFIVK